MKKFSVLFAAALLCLSLIACGRRDQSPATNPTTPSTTRATTPATMPATMPTIDTNVPDSDVDPYANDHTNGSEGNSNEGMFSQGK